MTIEARFQVYQRNVFQADMYPDNFIFFEAQEYWVSTFVFNEKAATMWMTWHEVMR